MEPAHHYTLPPKLYSLAHTPPQYPLLTPQKPYIIGPIMHQTPPLHNPSIFSINNFRIHIFNALVSFPFIGDTGYLQQALQRNLSCVGGTTRISGNLLEVNDRLELRNNNRL